MSKQPVQEVIFVERVKMRLGWSPRQRWQGDWGVGSPRLATVHLRLRQQRGTNYGHESLPAIREGWV